MDGWGRKRLITDLKRHSGTEPELIEAVERETQKAYLIGRSLPNRGHEDIGTMGVPGEQSHSLFSTIPGRLHHHARSLTGSRSFDIPGFSSRENGPLIYHFQCIFFGHIPACNGIIRLVHPIMIVHYMAAVPVRVSSPQDNTILISKI